MGFEIDIYRAISTVDGKALDTIRAGLAEMERANKTAGRRATQFTCKTMNVFLLGRTPFSIMRQCMAQIEKSKSALIDARYRLEKNSLLAEKYRQSAATKSGIDMELMILKAAKADSDTRQARIYVDGALKNIANYLSIYEQVRLAAGIPETWDELDYERAEAEHHIKQAFLQSLRDYIGPGRVNPGNCEYLENCGIGPIQGIREINAFLAGVNKDGRPVAMAEIDEWLDRMADRYRDFPANYMRRHGINPIDEWYVFKDRNKET